MCEEKEIRNDINQYNMSRDYSEDNKFLMFELLNTHAHNLIQYFKKSENSEDCIHLANYMISCVITYTCLTFAKIGDRKNEIKIKHLNKKNFVTISEVINEMSKIIELITLKGESHIKKTIHLSKPGKNGLSTCKTIELWWKDNKEKLTKLPTQEQIANACSVTAAGVNKSKYFKDVVMPHLAMMFPDEYTERYIISAKNAKIERKIDMNHEKDEAKTETPNEQLENEIDFVNMIEANPDLSSALLKIVKKAIDLCRIKNKHEDAKVFEEIYFNGINLENHAHKRILMALYKHDRQEKRNNGDDKGSK